MLLNLIPQLPTPVLGAAFQGLVAAVLMIIAFIGWIVNLINSQNHPPPPARRRRPNSDRSRSVQDEIDQFLNEARQSRQDQRRRRSSTAEAPSSEGIEVVGPGKPRRAPSQTRKSREEIWREQTATARRRPPQTSIASPRPQRPPAAADAAPPKPVRAERLGDAISGRHVGAPPKQNEIASHVQQRMASRIAAEVERDVPHTIETAVAADMGTFTAEAADSLGQQGYFQTKRRESNSLIRLRTLLREPQGIRNAIVVSEILSPPVSRRRPRSSGT